MRSSTLALHGFLGTRRLQGREGGGKDGGAISAAMTGSTNASVTAAPATRLVLWNGSEAELASEATAAPAPEAPAAEAATSSSGTTRHLCKHCKVVFQSNNKLHAHLRDGCQSKRLPRRIRLLGAEAGRKRQRFSEDAATRTAAISCEMGQVAATTEGDAPEGDVQQDGPEAPEQLLQALHARHASVRVVAPRGLRQPPRLRSPLQRRRGRRRLLRRRERRRSSTLTTGQASQPRWLSIR